LHSGGQRFDPARLHQTLRFDRQTQKRFAVQSDELTSYIEIINISLFTDAPRKVYLGFDPEVDITNPSQVH
jgi:hypothetical protein